MMLVGDSAMDKDKIKKLQAKGWQVGDVDEFLGLSQEELAYIEMKLALSRAVKERRLLKKFTQHQLAKLIGSSQSRISKIENNDPSVSLELHIKSLLSLGATREELARLIV